MAFRVVMTVYSLFARVLYMPSLGYCLLVTVGLKKMWAWYNNKVGPVLLVNSLVERNGNWHSAHRSYV